MKKLAESRSIKLAQTENFPFKKIKRKNSLSKTISEVLKSPNLTNTVQKQKILPLIIKIDTYCLRIAPKSTATSKIKNPKFDYCSTDTKTLHFLRNRSLFPTMIIHSSGSKFYSRRPSCKLSDAAAIARIH